MQVLYCWRCQMDVPMLDANEWASFAPYLSIDAIKRVREERGLELTAGRQLAYQQALDKYFELTGHRETNFFALFHHRVSLYGPPCDYCGKPLRTARAKVCAFCWKPVGEANRVA